VDDLVRYATSGNLPLFLNKLLRLGEVGRDAGLPLGRGLAGWRKIVVGDRDWRIVFATNRDETVATVWAIGDRNENRSLSSKMIREADLNISFARSDTNPDVRGDLSGESRSRTRMTVACEAMVSTGRQSPSCRPCKGNGVEPTEALPVDHYGKTGTSVVVRLCGSHRYQLGRMSADDFPQGGDAILHPKYGPLVGGHFGRRSFVEER